MFPISIKVRKFVKNVFKFFLNDAIYSLSTQNSKMCEKAVDYSYAI